MYSVEKVNVQCEKRLRDAGTLDQAGSAEWLATGKTLPEKQFRHSKKKKSVTIRLQRAYIGSIGCRLHCGLVEVVEVVEVVHDAARH